MRFGRGVSYSATRFTQTCVPFRVTSTITTPYVPVDMVRLSEVARC